MTNSNKKNIQHRIVKTIELNEIGDVNFNPLYYYGTKYNPILLTDMFTVMDFLDVLKIHFGWEDYFFDGDIIIDGKDIIRVKVIISEINIPKIVYLYVDCNHSCNLPIVPEFLYQIKKDAL